MKKKLTAFILSVAMLVTLLPSLAFAYENKDSNGDPYAWPGFSPEQGVHPRILFNPSDIDRIKANFSASQNAPAYEEFQRLINLSKKSQTITSISGTFDHELENMIEALAFDYAVNGNTTNGAYAIARAKEYFKIVANSSSSDSLSYRTYGAALYHLAEVLDWCYNLSSFTSSDANTLIGYGDSILKKLELYKKSKYDLDGQGAITGHGAENQLLRDILAFGIATWNTEDNAKFHRTDIYPIAMGRIVQEYVPVRNYLYQSHTTHQGTEYGWYRFYWDLYAETMTESMRVHNPVTLFDTDAMKEVLYGMLYARRPDGRFFSEGDNKNIWGRYSNFNRQVAKFAGDLFDNEYFKGEYRMMVGTETPNGGEDNVFTSNNEFRNYMSFNAVQWLIMNDPDIPFTKLSSNKGLPASRYFGSPISKIYARTKWGYASGDTGTSNAPENYGDAAAEMKIGMQYSANHDHMDAGTFQFYFRGLLTGDYGAQTDYGDSFDKNYYKRTVAHNGITIWRSNENWKTTLDYGTGVNASSNDGGQRAISETGAFSSWSTNAPMKRAYVINHDIAEDNSYSYIKGNITAAYLAAKADEVVRSMAFLPTGQTGAPAVMVIFDKVTSDSASYTKKFHLHTALEPAVTNNNRVQYDNSRTIEYSSSSSIQHNGRLIMNTLLPTSATITKVSGTKTSGSATDSANSTTYSGPTDSKYEPEWGRVEVQAATETATTRFLHVLTASDVWRVPADATLIGSESSDLVGARIKSDVTSATYSMVAMFANKGSSSLTSAASFNVSGDDDDIKFFIFGVGEGSWSVLRGGKRLATYKVKSANGAIAFTGASGSYTIKPYEASDLNTTTVAWYDYHSNSGTGSFNSEAGGTWKDLSSEGNDLTFTVTGNTYWYNKTVKGLRIKADGTNLINLPQTVSDAINSGKFTIEFVVNNLNHDNKELCVSLFGNAKSDFGIYKIIGANKIYYNLPARKTFINRPFRQMNYNEIQSGKGVLGHQCIITGDTEAGKLKWYLNGDLVAEDDYTGNTVSGLVSLISELNNSVVYQQIKVFDIPLTEAEAAGEYTAWQALDN